MNNEASQVLYISGIRLHNIRCFRKNVVIDLTQPSHGKPSWTLILGDNGTGKTTILRCIAMCLCDETSASGLLTELTGAVIRHGCTDAFIELRLKSSSDPTIEYTITTTLRKTDSVAEELKQVIEPRKKKFPRAQVFACGYGAAFGTIGSEVYEKYRLIDAVYSLFNYTARLQNPENALFRISHEGVDLDELLERINRILMLPPKSTQLDSSGLRVKTPSGDFVPAGALGDGYAATISWICDLLGWSLLAKRESFHIDLRGIVFLDEMEQHLHPSWQRAIIRLLARDFPGVQFIATTHAPLTAIGSTALDDQCCQLVLLEQDEDGVVSRSGLRPPRGRRADQVLTSYLFGLPSTTSDDVTSAVARYSQLSGRTGLTNEERTERKSLRKYLKTTLGSGESELQEHIRQAVHKTLKRMAWEAIETGKVTRDALDYEVRRQLRELFGSSEDAP